MAPPPFAVAHPYVRDVLPVSLDALIDVVPFASVAFKDRAFSGPGLWKGTK